MLPSPQRTLLLPLLVLSALLLLLLLLTPLHNPHTQDLSPVTTNNHPIINDNLTTYNEHINKIPIPFGSSSSSSSDHLNHFPSSRASKARSKLVPSPVSAHINFPPASFFRIHPSPSTNLTTTMMMAGSKH
ncbi:MAG: hypothetical protein L6R40_007159 [Gallowayella cf. fulva]|nr:MAG: hypothetical protein L6R40_007159 [Xanthomendoza cf. fulva]